jgi:hypothetical protein
VDRSIWLSPKTCQSVISTRKMATNDRILKPSSQSGLFCNFDFSDKTTTFGRNRLGLTLEMPTFLSGEASEFCPFCPLRTASRQNSSDRITGVQNSPWGF